LEAQQGTGHTGWIKICVSKNFHMLPFILRPLKFRS
jgi:hypothetical protein